MARVGSLLAELYSCCQVGANICKYSIFSLGVVHELCNHFLGSMHFLQTSKNENDIITLVECRHIHRYHVRTLVALEL